MDFSRGSFSPDIKWVMASAASAAAKKIQEVVGWRFKGLTADERENLASALGHFVRCSIEQSALTAGLLGYHGALDSYITCRPNLRDVASSPALIHKIVRFCERKPSTNMLRDEIRRHARASHEAIMDFIRELQRNGILKRISTRREHQWMPGPTARGFRVVSAVGST